MNDLLTCIFGFVMLGIAIYALAAVEGTARPNGRYYLNSNGEPPAESDTQPVNQK